MSRVRKKHKKTLNIYNKQIKIKQSLRWFIVRLKHVEKFKRMILYKNLPKLAIILSCPCKN